MVDLVFLEEQTRNDPRRWTVRDGANGEAIGAVEWLDWLGTYGFGVVPGGTAFSDSAAMREVDRFLNEVNR